VRRNNARGTSSYISPELLKESLDFTNKVDTWGLSCILHELTTWKVAFCRELYIQIYATDATNCALAIEIASATDFLQHHVAESIRDLLHRDYTYRIFSSYSRVLGLVFAQTLVESS
jgi:serine/threonine protein kinase